MDSEYCTGELSTVVLIGRTSTVYNSTVYASPLGECTPAVGAARLCDRRKLEVYLCLVPLLVLLKNFDSLTTSHSLVMNNLNRS